MPKGLKRCVTFLLITFGCVMMVGTAISQAVPNPPSQRADRFGVYNWGIDYTAYPGWPDRLNWGANKVTEAGSRTIRVALGGDNPYSVNPSQSNDYDPYWLANVAISSAYYTLFTSTSFQTYLLTVYSPADQRSDWVNGFDPGSFGYNSEAEQIKNLALYLYWYYPNKTFILLNWEGDNAMGYVADATSNGARWDAYANWLQARSDGVTAAKTMGGSNVYFGIEFNQVRKSSGAACGSSSPDPNHPYLNRCVIDYISGRVRNVDYYSYSAWNSAAVKVDNPGANLQQVLNVDLSTAQNAIQNSLFANGQYISLSPSNFLLGEYGFARTIYGECNAAAYVQEMINAVDGPGAFGVSYAVFWQVIDNKPPLISDCNIDWASFGLFRGEDAQITLLGATFRTMLQGGQPTIPADCPSINPGGIVNGAEGWQPIFHPSSLMSIFGANFSGSGNGVRILQEHHLYQIPRDNPSWWYESSTQINAGFPTGIVPGCAIVYVTDRRGIDSNGQVINVQP